MKSMPSTGTAFLFWVHARGGVHLLQLRSAQRPIVVAQSPEFALSLPLFNIFVGGQLIYSVLVSVCGCVPVFSAMSNSLQHRGL